MHNSIGNISVNITEIHLIQCPLIVVTDDEKNDKSFLVGALQQTLNDQFIHQAILIKSVVSEDKTDTIQYHICEYSGENKGTYTFYKIDKLDDKWQYIVSDCGPKKYTVQEVDTYMKQIAKKKDYSQLTHNCSHVAQDTFYKFSSKTK